jgi:hypothetical protein
MSLLTKISGGYTDRWTDMTDTQTDSKVIS